MTDLNGVERWRQIKKSEKLVSGHFNHKVHVKAASDDHLFDHHEWCIEFCDGQYTVWHTLAGGEFEFEYELDALAFKLRWT